MAGGGGAHEDAEAILRRAARPDRVWPVAVGVLLLYLASSLWTFERPFGDTGREAVLRATPTVWVPLLIAVVLAWGRLAGRAEARAGGSPWRWPRVARRALTALAVLLPLICFAVAPAAAVIAADRGSTQLAAPLGVVLHVVIAVR